MRVDEAGRDGLAGGDDFSVPGRSRQVPNRHDAVARHPDIGFEAGLAGAVEHGGIADD